ncbi:hypothetical protein Bpfe_011040, partial [Biomphalaria pfeifferi]
MGSKLSTQSHKNAILNQDNTKFCLHNERCESNIKECLHATNDQCYVQSDDTEGVIIGHHETQVSEGGEADLHKYLVN